MKVDRYTKIVLTVIAVSLGVIALNGVRGVGGSATYASPAQGEQAEGSTPIAHYQLAAYRDGGGEHVLVVDNRTDKLYDVALYDNPRLQGKSLEEGVSVHGILPGTVQP